MPFVTLVFKMTSSLPCFIVQDSGQELKFFLLLSQTSVPFSKRIYCLEIKISPSSYRRIPNKALNHLPKHLLSDVPGAEGAVCPAPLLLVPTSCFSTNIFRPLSGLQVGFPKVCSPNSLISLTLASKTKHKKQQLPHL